MGTGKTLASVALSYHMLREYRVQAASFNFPVSFGVAPHYKHTVATVDEAGVFFDNRVSYKDKELSKTLAELSAFLRKRGSYVIAPSYITVDKRLRNGLRLYRIANIANIFWVYHYEEGPEDLMEQRPGINYHEGRLILVNPRFFFNVYDTYRQPTLEDTTQFISTFCDDTIPADVLARYEASARPRGNYAIRLVDST
jgi:hypothetical protein